MQAVSSKNSQTLPQTTSLTEHTSPFTPSDSIVEQGITGQSRIQQFEEKQASLSETVQSSAESAAPNETVDKELYYTHLLRIVLDNASRMKAEDREEYLVVTKKMFPAIADELNQNSCKFAEPSQK